MSDAAPSATWDSEPRALFDPRQHLLFPATSDLRADALEALERFDCARALELVARARESGLSDPDLDAWEAAARWLAPRCRDCAAPQAAARGVPAQPLDAATRASLADAFLALPRALRAGQIRAATFCFVDEILARLALRCPSPADPFLDDGQRVHLGALSLVRADVRRAHDLLRASLRSGHRERADLWGHLGDARRRLGDVDGIDECFVRALLLDADALDLAHTSHQPLADLFERLCARQSESCARERLLPEAWIAGVLSIPIGNRWLEPETLADLRARSERAAGEPARLRRFSLLFYVDRSRGEVDLAAREEMDALDHELLERCMRAVDRDVPLQRSRHGGR